jgi:3-methylfumaryl-CoA hydratase
MTELDVDHLRSWIGKQETLHDQVTRFPIAALSATLDRDDAAPEAGDPLPPLWHWLYFLPTARQSILGPDGHPARGGFLPPVPLPRRMWAGGRFTFHQPLRVDEAITRVSTVQDVTIKQGRNGALCFVLVKHQVSGTNGLALEEEHDIVYRDAPQPGEAPASPRPVRTDGVWQRDIQPTDPLLFRYSALTFNSHRIHYDRRYVTETEGYPGLIVHGPLIATLLIDLLRRNTDQPVATFRFRAVSPLFDIAPFSVHGAPDGKGGAALWARNPTGHLAMEADATF